VIFGVAMVGAILAVIIIGGRDAVTGATSVTQALAPDGYENINQLGRQLFTTYVFPLEITAGLLTIAVIGAVVLSRRPKDVQPLPEPESMTEQGDEPLTMTNEEGGH
jgi:NADH-quinone oxidoreductase subunit J